ncbi:hypothetical protein PANDA_015669 [Ailuropoda melanoleuca]|uniref:RING-type domain-containing protein n=1 Tax=Ailuropoda melanoleuca TaxID=9646 RepID=D2HTX1_AILME|nr:hypothetical protein PANDA_015669 [Ailuropoda melanoleuca]
MDWFHCNQCFRKDGDRFFVTSCGHIFCKKCVTLEKCAVCGTACKHLALSDNVWSFQKKQTDLLIAFYKHRITKLEAAMQEAQQMVTSQEKNLQIGTKEAVTPRPSSRHSSQVVRSEGKQNPTRESSWFPATSSADSLRTETDGISQVKRSMDYFQMKVLQGLIYTYCIKEGL